ncbi:MAG: hypothetical protein HY067_21115 [Betaproteobacteria bacterium]|nr:hypothetical protein [Betaproteobacteria bacterium]
MNAWPRFLFVVALLPVPGYGDDVAVTLRAIPEFHGERADSPFAVANDRTGLGRDRAIGEAELRAKPFDVNLVSTVRTTAREASEPDNEIVLNELYYDTQVAGQRIGLGKKIMSWDVGFAFRPLDVIQQENRRALFTTTLEGIPYVSWERFGAEDAWMVVLANPGRSREVEARDDQSLAIKYYLRSDRTDWHAVARISERYRGETGAAFSRVTGDGTELHASVLYQRRYEKQINRLAGQNSVLLASADPVETLTYENGVKALLGFTWTGEAGWSLLGEAWYDGSAFTHSEWKALADLTRSQSGLQGMPGVPAGAIAGNIAWSAQFFNHPNLLRENLLLRLSHRGESRSIDPALDVLVTPEDGGWVVTASAGYEGDRFRLDAGYRAYGGPKDAAYRLLPEDRVAFVALQISF